MARLVPAVLLLGLLGPAWAEPVRRVPVGTTAEAEVVIEDAWGNALTLGSATVTVTDDATGVMTYSTTTGPISSPAKITLPSRANRAVSGAGVERRTLKVEWTHSGMNGEVEFEYEVVGDPLFDGTPTPGP